MLTENSVRASDRRAQFIGLDAYEQAGGTVMRDLFEHDDGGWLRDVPLLDRLVTEKLKAEADINRPRPFIVRCLRRAVYTTTIKPLSMVLTCISISCYNARDAISIAKQAEHGCPEMRLRMPRTNRRHARHSMTHWAGMFFVTCCREPGQGTRLRPMSGRSKPFEEH